MLIKLPKPDTPEPRPWATLPLRPRTSSSDSPAETSIQVHPIDDGIIVKIQPPREPVDDNPRYVASPSDIVLCIDLSLSMAKSAQAPEMKGEENGDFGLTLLDLAKHAARTIIETLDERDRLGIVTFSTESEVLQRLTPMTPTNKAAAVQAIESMVPNGTTNIWHALRDGLELFEHGDSRSGSRVPALLLLTDGQPNTACPPRGYVPMLRQMGHLPATIHTFGFGYDIRSGLLKSIAEIGGGNYSFIPDAGMIGTVFIHAVANIQSTFATEAKLNLTYPTDLKLTGMTGKSVVKQAPKDLGSSTSQLTILLGNLQYGQSRDIYLRCDPAGSGSLKDIAARIGSPPTVSAALEYKPLTPDVHLAVAHQNLLEGPTCPPLDPAEVAYHVSRTALINFLSSRFNLNTQDEYFVGAVVPAETMHKLLQDLAASLPATRPEFAASHPGCRALLTDLCGALPETEPALPAFFADASLWAAAGGQVAMALTNTAYFLRWGAHYLPSLAGAHARQACNSFKDAGPLRYGADSPLFVACRDRLDATFNALPPPRPSRAATEVSAGPSSAASYGPPYGGSSLRSMARYNRADAGCFAGSCEVQLEGGKKVRVGKLRRGMRVVTPRGARRVVAVVRMPVMRAEMCLVGGGRDGRSGLLITPWHPVLTWRRGEETERWVFPREVARRSVRYTGAVYSVLLGRDEDPEAHAILVNGVWGVTMGHGLTGAGGRHDVRAHEFFGDYVKVSRALAQLPRRSGGLVLRGGLSRDPLTGLINGFTRELRGQAKMLSARERKAAVNARVSRS